MGLKVLNLRCANGHGFEGWFGSDEDFLSQNGRGLVECPLCADKIVTRLPSAPRLNLSASSRSDKRGDKGDDRRGDMRGDDTQASAANSETPGNTGTDATPASTPHHADLPAAMQAAWIRAVRELVHKTEDVGPRFAEEARRIHYGEAPERGIRGKASAEERAALQDEGIETFSVPLPKGLEGPLQ